MCSKKNKSQGGQEALENLFKRDDDEELKVDESNSEMPVIQVTQEDITKMKANL